MFSRLQPISPFAEMTRLHREMDRIFQRSPRHGQNPGSPPVNIWEDESHIFLEAEIPGITANDLTIEVSPANQLTIKGQRRRPEPSDGMTWYRRETSNGEFSRVLELSAPVDAEQVEAKLQDGVLLIQLPKAENARARTVSVRGEDSK